MFLSSYSGRRKSVTQTKPGACMSTRPRVWRGVTFSTLPRLELQGANMSSLLSARWQVTKTPCRRSVMKKQCKNSADTSSQQGSGSMAIVHPTPWGWPCIRWMLVKGAGSKSGVKILSSSDRKLEIFSNKIGQLSLLAV